MMLLLLFILFHAMTYDLIQNLKVEFRVACKTTNVKAKETGIELNHCYCY